MEHIRSARFCPFALGLGRYVSRLCVGFSRRARLTAGFLRSVRVTGRQLKERAPWRYPGRHRRFEAAFFCLLFFAAAKKSRCRPAQGQR
ncbi:hypothetical protein PSAB6_650001 [Paraburkholderia sabiae]|nr:hypothetical protein PSAB6_650001 [Paraburkholderia sabiae]